MINEEKILKAIEALADTITRKENEIGGLNWKIGNQKEQIESLEELLSEKFRSKEECEKVIKEQREQIEFLEAKNYELEERIAIMTEQADEGPMPHWEITPAKKEKEGE